MGFPSIPLSGVQAMFLFWGSSLNARLPPFPCAIVPSFVRELSDETVVLGQSVTLACQVSAQPAAQATWTKGKRCSGAGGQEGRGAPCRGHCSQCKEGDGPQDGRGVKAGWLLDPPPGLLCPAADGAPLESTSRVLISSTLKNFQLLTILVVTAEDLGVYTCSVSNTLGTAATTAVLRKAGEWTEPGPRWGRSRNRP